MTFAPMKISLCQTLHLEVKSWLFYIYIQSTLDLVEMSVVLHLITFEKKAQRSINFSLSRRSFALLWLCACCCLIFTHFQIHPGVFLTMFRIKVIGLLTHIEGKKCFLSKKFKFPFWSFWHKWSGSISLTNSCAKMNQFSNAKLSQLLS